MAAYGAFAITPSDSSDLPGVATGGIYVGGAGAVTVTLKNGSTVTFSAVPVGTTLYIQAKRVWATGTGATLLVGLIGE